MSVLTISKAHAAQLEQLTGCRYATLVTLTAQVREQLQRSGRGRPFKHSMWVTVVLALMKLRMGVTVRTMEALTGIDSVTVARSVSRVMTALGQIPLARKIAGARLLVDTTSCRVSTTELKAYSGHKHHRCAKVQVLSDSRGQVIDVSTAYLGSVHDKSVWNKEFPRLKPLLDCLVLGDKAYVGGRGEVGQADEQPCLLRPIKRGENAWKENKEKAKQFNRELSRERVGVEHVFARLKTWRVLNGLFSYRWQRLGEVIRALAVAHNANRQLKATG